MSMSTPTRRALQGLDDKKGMLGLLELSGLAEPVYICNDTRDHVIWSKTWLGLGFDLKLPNDAAKENGRAQLRVDNVGRELTADLEALPPGAALMGTIRMVHRNTPEVVDYEFISPLTNIHADMGTLSATVGPDDVMRRPAVLIRHDPVTAPALFPD